MIGQYLYDEGLLPARNTDDLSGYILRQCVGYTGFLLPLALVLVAGLRPMGIGSQWSPLSSISAYFYSGAVSLFAGGLVTLAIFLLAYQGYDNAFGIWDRVFARIAALAALVVAIYPTGAPDGYVALIWWKPIMGYIHYGAAIVLFLSFAVFALWLFPKPVAKVKEDTDGKNQRNRIFWLCGAGIIGSLAWAAFSLYRGDPIFWPETLALWSFAVSWLTKGRALHTITTFLSQSDKRAIRATRAVRFIAGLDSISRPNAASLDNR